MEDKYIKILEEFISNYKDIQEKYKDDEIQAEIERSCYFEEVPAIQIENLLQAYKQDEKMIDEMSKYIWKYDCCGYEIGKSGKCKGYYIDTDCKEKCIIDYFRKKCNDG